jgi:hypothetical protein
VSVAVVGNVKVVVVVVIAVRVCVLAAISVAVLRFVWVPVRDTVPRGVEVAITVVVTTGVV